MTCQLCLHDWCLQHRNPYKDTHFIQESVDYCSVLRCNSMQTHIAPLQLPLVVHEPSQCESFIVKNGVMGELAP